MTGDLSGHVRIWSFQALHFRLLQIPVFNEACIPAPCALCGPTEGIWRMAAEGPQTRFGRHGSFLYDLRIFPVFSGQAIGRTDDFIDLWLRHGRSSWVIGPTLSRRARHACIWTKKVDILFRFHGSRSLDKKPEVSVFHGKSHWVLP
jgi:hypothetical protein